MTGADGQSLFFPPLPWIAPCTFAHTAHPLPRLSPRTLPFFLAVDITLLFKKKKKKMPVILLSRLNELKRILLFSNI